MSNLFVRIYDWFDTHKIVFWCVLALAAGIMALLALRVKYDEQITSFFPKEGNSSLVFDNMKMKDRIIIIFSAVGEADPERLIECGGVFREEFLSRAGEEYVQSVMSTAGDGQADDVVGFIYDHLPVFLTDADYARIDSLISSPEAVEERLKYDYNLLLSPAGIGVKNVVLRDPLGFGGGVVARLQDLALAADYRIYDDHIFSQDLGSMLIIVNPAYGTGDTGSNEILIDAIEEAIHATGEEFGDINAEYAGGPAYAVANARRIKQDTFLTLTVVLAVIVTFILLAFRNRWAVVLILAPVIFGGLFALAVISLIGSGGISAIAVGAGAAVFGIALSYSIHVVSHSNHISDPKQVIAELAYPLTVGSFTTIGAFAGLMFTQSQLLRDFGLFSSLTLVGTTLFCLVFLPHFLKRGAEKKPAGRFLNLIEKITDYPYDRNKWLIGGLIALAVVCSFFFSDVKFDSDMMNLNYSPPELKAAEKKLEGIFGDEYFVPFASVGKDAEEAFAAGRMTNGLLDSLAAAGVIKGYSSATAFLPPPSEQERRIEKWNSFWAEGRRESIVAEVGKGALLTGFSEGAFSRFGGLMEKEYTAFAPGEEGTLPLFADWMAAKDDFSMYLSQVSIDPERKNEVYNAFAHHPGTVIVDRGHFANQMAKSVNADFSLILFFSSFLIFGALILSYGRIELALMAFLPMFLSWIIILGLMVLFGIEFNIVNIILSTFIFGIGDDFSIFIMDGLLSEYKNGRKLLSAHKTAIFFSAVTTIVGIGALIFAKHPALHSLAGISIFGIITVVLVSFTVQPVIFRMFIGSQTRRGGFPYTLAGLLNTLYAFVYFLVGCLVLHAAAMTLILLPVGRRRKKLWFHVCINKATKIFLHTMFTTKRVAVNEPGETFEKPAVVIANHQSFIDILVLLSLHPKLVMVTNGWVWKSPFFGRLVRYADFYHTADGYEKLAETLRPLVEQGYSVVVFPEGSRSADNKIGRFHKGAFYLAEQLRLDILPIALYGNGLVSSKRQPFYIKKGLLVSKILPRITTGDESFGQGYGQRTKQIGVWFRERYGEVFEEYNRTCNPYFRDALIKNYIYKGPVLEWYMRIKVRMERSYRLFDELIPRGASVVDIGCGYGGLAYMLSMLSPCRQVLGIDYDAEKTELANHNFSRNERINFVCADALSYDYPRADVFVMNDVLHYMDYGSQDALLERCFGLVNPGGMVIVRDGDSAQKNAQKVTERTEKWSTRIIGFNKTVGGLHFTSTERIVSFARSRGFTVRCERNDGKTSNTIYIMTRCGNE